MRPMTPPRFIRLSAAALVLGSLAFAPAWAADAKAVPAAVPPAAAASASAPDAATLDGRVQDIKSEEIKLDDKMVSSYLYTPLEVSALHRGGVQRIYLGNLKVGEHELVAYFTGKG